MGWGTLIRATIPDEVGRPAQNASRTHIDSTLITAWYRFAKPLTTTQSGLPELQDASVNGSVELVVDFRA